MFANGLDFAFFSSFSFSVSSSFVVVDPQLSVRAHIASQQHIHPRQSVFTQCVPYFVFSSSVRFSVVVVGFLVFFVVVFVFLSLFIVLDRNTSATSLNVSPIDGNSHSIHRIFYFPGWYMQLNPMRGRQEWEYRCVCAFVSIFCCGGICYLLLHFLRADAAQLVCYCVVVVTTMLLLVFTVSVRRTDGNKMILKKVKIEVNDTTKLDCRNSHASANLHKSFKARAFE